MPALSILNLSVGFVLVIKLALITAIVFQITNEYISKLKTSHTKTRDWINVITLLFAEKTSKQSMIGEKRLMIRKPRIYIKFITIFLIKDLIN